MKYISATLFFAVSATGVSAGQTYDSTGTIAGQSAAEITPLSDGHMIMLLPSAHKSFDMAADGHPFEDMTGTCDGAVEVLNGAALGQGLCVYENGAGETMAVRWTGENVEADGTFHGQWIIVGATGGLAGSTGGGDFTSLTDRNTGAQTVSLTGAMLTK